MRLAPPSTLLLYDTLPLQGYFQREGLEGSRAHVIDNLRAIGHQGLGTLPTFTLAGSAPGEVRNGAAGMGV